MIARRRAHPRRFAFVASMPIFSTMPALLPVVRCSRIAALALVAGCALPAPCARGEAADGTCCPPWTRASGGECAPRRWSEVAAAADGLGVQASYPAVDVDEQGRAWLAWEQGYFETSA